MPLPRPVPAADPALMLRIDKLHLDFPFAGGRVMRDFLVREGFDVGRLHVATLMKRMRIVAIYRAPEHFEAGARAQDLPLAIVLGPMADNGSRLAQAADHAVQPSWAIDITYFPMARGFVYLAVVVDWFSRKVLA
jgi:putative transposase